MPRFSCLFLLFIVAFCFAGTARDLSPADSSLRTDPPRVGLVLSGGGAKGFAHIEVLREMERAGIRPDFIAGTSMGAVVGGLYASGYSVDELEDIVRSGDWGLITSNRVRFNEIAFEEKEYYNRYLVELPIVDWRLQLPTGLIEGQELSQLLHRLTWPVKDVVDFDALPIPFRAVATDAQSGREVVIRKGYLHDALRASIAIPTAFTAFRTDSTLLVDGGVVNNFPVDVVREMGAELVIGSNVGDDDFKDLEGLGNFSEILLQLSMARSYEKLQAHIGECDVYVSPDLSGFGTASFNRFEGILERGRQAAEAEREAFEALAERLGVEGEELPERGLSLAELRIRQVNFTGNSLFNTTLLESKLDLPLCSPVGSNQLEQAIARVYGINAFRKVDYSLDLKEGEKDLFDLNIRVLEKPDALLFAAIHYDNLFSVGILLNLTLRDYIGRLSRLHLITDISENPSFRADYYRYFTEKKRYALNVRYDFLFRRLPVYEQGRQRDIVNSRDQQLLIQAISTRSLKQSYFLGVVYERNRSASRFNFNFPEEVRFLRQEFFGPRAVYTRNSLNNRNFPTSGAETFVQGLYKLSSRYRVNLFSGEEGFDFQTLTGERREIPKEGIADFLQDVTPRDYATAFFAYQRYFPLAKDQQLAPELGLGMTLSSESQEKLFQNFPIGGLQRVLFTDTRAFGWNYAELFAPNFMKVGAAYQYTGWRKLYLRAGTNVVGLMQHVPLSNAAQLDFDGLALGRRLDIGYGADLSYDSFFGPITVGLGGNSGDRNLRFYFSFGYSFNFNDR